MGRFHKTSLLPYGKSLSAIKDVDRKMKLALDFNLVDHDTWDISFGAYDDFANNRTIDFEEVEYPKHFLYYVQLMSSMMHSTPDREKLCRQYDAQLVDYRSTWVYVDAMLCNVIFNCKKATLQEEPVDVAEVDREIELIEQYVNSQFSGEHKFKLHLAKAERALMAGNMKGAIELYEDALEGAQSTGNVLFHAWINELYSGYWLKLNSKRIAKPFVLNSFALWEQWGADAKMVEIMNRFPELFRQSASTSTGRRGSTMRRSRMSSVTPKETREYRENSFVSGGSDLDLFSSFEATKASLNSARKVVDIDINTVLKVTNSITNETDLESLVDKILGHLMNNTGATRAVFLFNEKNSLRLQKILTSTGSEEFDLAHTELCAPMSLVNLIFRTQESKVYMDCPTDANLANDPYIEKYQPKSILCSPIKHQNLITGAIYLENRLQSGSFTATRVNLVKSLMASASIAIANAQLLRKNKELSQALQSSGLAEQDVPKYNVETPMQKAIDAIKSIKEKFDANDPINNTLDVVLSTLTSDGLFAANLGEVNDKDGKGIDQDTKNWIESSLLMTNKSNGEDNRTSSVPRRIDSVADQAGARSLLENHQKLDMDAIYTELQLSNQPAFDCFKLHDLTDGQPLAFLASHMIKKFKLHETFKLNSNTMEAFFQKIESSYNKLPYHNSIHATDVLQTVEMLLLNTPDIIKHFNSLEIFSIIIASAIHDLDHPGINNNFLVQLNHPLAVMYNDIAVLESHHVARAFEIAAMSGLNIFESLTPEQYRMARKMIISIVLATDLAQHFQFISKFKGKVSSSSLKLEDDADRHLIMEMAVKCGDLGNPVKTFEKAKQWTNLVMEEFYRQGDREKLVGLPVSKFMDRNDPSVSKCQIGFIDFLVAPLFDAWIAFSKTDFTALCQSNIANNRAQWQLQADDPNILPGVAVTEFERLDSLLDIVIPPIAFGKQASESRRASAKRFTLTKSGSMIEPELTKIVEHHDDTEVRSAPNSLPPTPSRTTVLK
ncbi:cAMP-specific 3',5'-cyclic phosphodiesterase 4D [Kappamyces sp. JEL0680]|nr:cAMP-specific 3',5'-cyclic phosphodiesterase 4D [Kappamyces sp. JEL0680]